MPPDTLAPIFEGLSPLIRNAVLMVFQGRSTVPGRRPSWLDAATDIRFVHLSGADDTVLHFQAPPLGEAAPLLYRQQEFWPTKPAAQDTGFDLLGEVLADVRDSNEDSPRFDPPLLTRLAGFGSILDHVYRELDLIGHYFTTAHPAILNEHVLDNARRLREETPPPQRVRVVGRLDMIETTTQTFALELDAGERVRGVLQNGSIAAAKMMVDQRVLVLGMAVYRPSGRVLRIDAEAVSPGYQEAPIWSTIPEPVRRAVRATEVRQQQTPETGAPAIFNTWPGTETEEELLTALRNMD